MTGSALPDGTYSISQFAWEVKGLLADEWSSVWVAGEVQRLSSAARGHLYFELVEKGRGDNVKGKLDCVLWSEQRRLAEAAFRRAGVELVEGVVLRCRGTPDFWPAGGRFQFIVGDVDPVFSLGDLERRRRETLRTLEREGLLERNPGLALSPMPLDIGLVTSEGSAAEADFVDSLAQSGVGFRVFRVHSAVQGAMAEAEIERAFNLLHAFVRGGGSLDAVALVRGGGSRFDLAAFDSRRVARVVALCPLPVVCGVGHQIDQSIADLVAHTSCKTPTEAAEFLVTRAETTARRIQAAGAKLASTGAALLQRRQAGFQELQRGLVSAARHAGSASGRAVDALGGKLRTRAEISVVRAAERLAATSVRLPGPARRALAASAAECRRQEARVRPTAERLLKRAAERLAATSVRLPGPARRALAASAAECRRQEAHVRPTAERLLKRAAERVAARGRLCAQLSPERTLERGFSLTRTEDGRLVRSAEDVSVGTRLRTSVQNGTIGSTVHEMANERGRPAPREERDRT